MILFYFQSLHAPPNPFITMNETAEISFCPSLSSLFSISTLSLFTHSARIIHSFYQILSSGTASPLPPLFPPFMIYLILFTFSRLVFHWETNYYPIRSMVKRRQCVINIEYICSATSYLSFPLLPFASQEKMGQ